MIHIDFETKSRLDIKDVGASKYSKHAEVLCLSYRIGDGPIKCWNPSMDAPQDLFDAIERGDEVHAFNASFEIAIWTNLMVPKYGWPVVKPEQWRCTMARALVRNVPGSLDTVTQLLRLSVRKDLAGKKVMQKLARTHKPTKKNPSIWRGTPEEFQRLYAYCNNDVATECAVDEIVPPMSNRELSIFHYDQKVNQRGIRVDKELVECAMQVWDQYCETLNAELHDLTFGSVNTANQVSALIGVLNETGLNIRSLKKEAVEYHLGKKDLSPTARRLLEIRSEVSLTSIKKFNKMLSMVEEDGRIRGCLQYHGASQTGRWAGRGVQFQNLVRGNWGIKCKKALGEKIETVVADIKSLDLSRVSSHLNSKMTMGKMLSSLVRSAIIPGEENKFVVGDFSSVEARCVAWLAEEDWLLQAFHEGRDTYIEMASLIYKVPKEQIDEDQRWVGKSVILGATYGMGPQKFQGTVLKQGRDLPLDMCVKTIKVYRDSNPNIRSFWYQVGDAAVRTVKTGRPTKVGKVAFHLSGRWLLARLPSGRDIAYLDPSVVPGKYGDQIEFTGIDDRKQIARIPTYGSKLVENLSQAICRDLLVHSMSNLERNNYAVAFHVHDECVCEVPSGFGSPEEMRTIMKRIPGWAEGFPLDSSTWEGGRYRK